MLKAFFLNRKETKVVVWRIQAMPQGEKKRCRKFTKGKDDIFNSLKNQLKAFRLIHSVKWTDKQYKYKNQSFW